MRSVSPGSGGVTDVLMVATTMGVLNGVHGNTTDAGPVLLLGLSLVVCGASLKHGLVSSLAASGDADHGSAGALDGLASAGREADTGLSALLRVADDEGRAAGGAGVGSAVTNLSLNVRDDGSFWHSVDRKDVADNERGLGARVDELAGVHALHGNEVLGALLVAVRVTEDDLGKGRATAGVVHNSLHNTPHVTILKELNMADHLPLALREVEGSEAGGSDALVGMGFEDFAASPSLHCVGGELDSRILRLMTLPIFQVQYFF